jgi:hypothetical protein
MQWLGVCLALAAAVVHAAIDGIRKKVIKSSAQAGMWP